MAIKRKKRSPEGDMMQMIQQCPMCEAAYEPLEIKVVDEVEEKHLVHVTCRRCSHSVVALILHQPSGVSSMGLITDAHPEDLQRCKQQEVVTWDDCIEWHKYLKEDLISKETFML